MFVVKEFSHAVRLRIQGLLSCLAALSFALVLFLSPSVFAQHKGLGFQAVLKKADGTFPTATGLTVILQVLDPVTDCVLREESHANVNVTNGYFSVVLGDATGTTPVGRNPSPVLTIPQVMDNVTTRTGLNCVDINNTITASGQTYIPADTHPRKLRVRTVIGPDPIVGDFMMRATAYAVNSETLSGKTSNAFIQASPAITQANVESIFGRYSTLDTILNGTYAGNAATATALATAPGACAAGKYVSAIAANGTITCATPAAGTVTSVTSANAYLSVATGTSTPALTLNVGAVANTVAAGNDARFTDSRAPSGAAGGDLSGTYPNPSVAKVAGKSVILTTPASGEVLKYDGTNFVNSSAADSTKLPLAGGTMSGAVDMASNNLTNVGYVTMASGKNLHLSNNAADPAGLVAADKGKVWYNSTSGQVKYWDGTAAIPLGAAGAGMQTLGGQSGTAQTLAIGTSGTAPAWSSASDVHTLNVPMASTASVTAGLLSKADYDTFTAKLGTATAFSGDVTGTSSTTSVDKIKGKAITAGAYAAGQTLRYDGTAWVNAVLGFSDLGSKPTTLAGYGITDAQSSTLADGKILVGNASNAATAVTMSGDASLDNGGAITLATVPITKGGTGVTSFAGDKVITTSAAGALQASSCGLGQVIGYTAGGAINCTTLTTGTVTSVTAGSGLNVGAGPGGSITATGTLNVDSASANTASKIVARDGSGNFAAGAITNGSNILKGATSGTLTMTVPATVTSYTLTWPAAVGGAGAVLTTDTSGNLSWGSAAAISDSSYAAKGAVQFLTDASTSGLTVSSGVVNVNSGTGANQIVKLTAASKYPAVDGSLITNLDPTHLSAAVAIANGGTGQTAKTAAFDALSPNTTKGDLEVHNGTNNVRLPAGTNNYVLTADSAQAAGVKWAAAPASTDATYAAKGVLQFLTDAATSGITIASGVANVNFGTGANQIVKLDASSKLPAVDGSALTNLNAGNIATGTLAVARGGTAATSFTANTMTVANGSGSALASFTCSVGEYLTFGAGGIAACGGATVGTGFVKNGNSYGANVTVGTNDAFDLGIETSGVTRMTVLSTGEVGIGTTAPAVALEVVDGTIGERSSTKSPKLAIWGQASNTFPASIELTGSRTNGTAYPQANDILGQITFKNGNSNSGGAGIYGVSTETQTASAGGTFLAFQTTASGGNSNTERVRIDQNGNVGIGATAPGARLEVVNASTATSGALAGTKSTQSMTSGSASTATARGVYGIASYASVATSPSGTATALEGYTSNAGSGTLGSAYGVYANIENQATGTISLAYAGNFSVTQTAGTITNARGINIGTIQGTNKFSLYASDSTAPSYFAGSVGIGTASPTNILSFDGTAARKIWMERNTAAATIGSDLTVQAGGTKSGNTNQDGGDLYLSSGIATGTGASQMFFQTVTAGTTGTTDRNPSTKMMIDGLGNVGIGTTAPVSNLDVVSQSSAPAFTGILSDQYSTDNWGAQFTGRKARGTLAAPTAIANGDWLTAWHPKAWDGASWVEGGYMAFVSNGTVASGSVPTDFFINTGSSGMGSERLRVTSAGNVGIGVAAPQAALDIVSAGTSSAIIVPRATTANRPSVVNGMIRYNSSTNLFEFYQNGGWVNYTTVSDGRLKTNVIPIHQGLDLVNKLNPVFFDWDQNNPRAQSFGTKHQVGFIAQEVEKILPEVVNKGEDSYRSVEYGKIVSVVVAAVKELYMKVLGIDKEIAELKARAKKVEQENAALKAYLCSKDRMAPICK